MSDVRHHTSECLSKIRELHHMLWCQIKEKGSSFWTSLNQNWPQFWVLHFYACIFCLILTQGYIYWIVQKMVWKMNEESLLIIIIIVIIIIIILPAFKGKNLLVPSNTPNSKQMLLTYIHLWQIFSLRLLSTYWLLSEKWITQWIYIILCQGHGRATKERQGKLSETKAMHLVYFVKVNYMGISRHSEIGYTVTNLLKIS